MATTLITKTNLPETGYNLTDSADFDTLSTGSGNGVHFTYEPDLIVALKNGTGGTATFTFKTPTPAALAAKGITVDDVTRTVADGKTWIYPLSAIFKQAAGTVIVECDVAGTILLLGK